MLEAENGLTAAILLLSGFRCRLLEIGKDLDSIIMSPELQVVKDKVTALTGAVVSVEALMLGMAGIIRERADDKAAMLQLADDIEADTTGLVAAAMTGQGDPNAGNAGGAAPAV